MGKLGAELIARLLTSWHSQSVLAHATQRQEELKAMLISVGEEGDAAAALRCAARPWPTVLACVPWVPLRLISLLCAAWMGHMQDGAPGLQRHNGGGAVQAPAVPG